MANFNLGPVRVVKPVLKVHTWPMPQEPAGELSDELKALNRRAELAISRARLLIAENDTWRGRVERQLDYMFELGADLRRARRPQR